MERKVPLVFSQTFLSQIHIKVTAWLVAARRVMMSFALLSCRQATWVKMSEASLEPGWGSVFNFCFLDLLIHCLIPSERKKR